MKDLKLEKKVRYFMEQLIHEKGYVSSVDILMRMNFLSRKDYEDWRFGRVDYLEKVCKVNLKKLSTINKTIRRFSSEMDLKESYTAYNKYGKGKREKLRFSKSGDENIEKAYSTHYLNESRIEDLKIEKASGNSC
jgi:hypothetical protein